MLWLAGLIGMMVLGSVAVLGTRGGGDDPGDEALGQDDGMADPVVALPEGGLPVAELPAQDARTGSAQAGCDRRDDRLVIIWDDSDGAGPPLLGLGASGTPGMTDILLDGAPVATLPKADVPPLDSIVVISESAAAGLRV